MAKKYELTDETLKRDNYTLHRIKALTDIPEWDVRAGDIGGWIESEENLSQEGLCWVGENAEVFGNAKVNQDAMVSGYARVFGDAEVFGYAQVSGNACVYGDAWVYGGAKVYDNAEVYINAKVHCRACVYGGAVVRDNANVAGYARVCGYARVYGGSCVYGDACICDFAHVSGNAIVHDGEVRKPSHILVVGPVGSRRGYVTLNRLSGTVCTGCFKGTLDEFEKAVKERHGDNEHGKDYALVISMFKAARTTAE